MANCPAPNFSKLQLKTDFLNGDHTTDDSHKHFNYLCKLGRAKELQSCLTLHDQRYGL